MVKQLEVMLWGQRVGTLISPDDRRGRILFYFDKEFTRHGYDIAPLRASLASVAVQNGLPVYGEQERLYSGLPSFIADSLPDNWGDKVFGQWLKAKGIRSREVSALDRLAYIGRRGMGALEFRPPMAEDLEKPFSVEVSQLYDLAQSALRQAEAFHSAIDLPINSLMSVGTSAGGRRPKAIINYNAATGECYSGQTAAPTAGFTPMIIKFDEQSNIPTTAIEYSFYLMAKDVQMRMQPSSLLHINGCAHFLTERFDRTPSGKVHVQTLAAMCPEATSYEDLLTAAERLNVDKVEMQQLFLQMVMNVACGNVDDHSKNFSFTMAQDSKWHVAPAYDFTFAVDVNAPHYINRHCLSVNGKVEEITANDLIEVARQHNLSHMDKVIERVLSVSSQYRHYGIAAGVSEKWIQTIEKELAARAAILTVSEPG